MPFRIHALPPGPFAPLFAMTDADLANRRTCRIAVAENPGTPCRVSLAEAKVGEAVILVNYDHLPSGSPYRSSHAIFVREGAEQAHPAIGEVPGSLLSRLISLRVFDNNDMMIAADVMDGISLADALTRALAD